MAAAGSPEISGPYGFWRSGAQAPTLGLKTPLRTALEKVTTCGAARFEALQPGTRFLWMPVKSSFPLTAFFPKKHLFFQPLP